MKKPSKERRHQCKQCPRRFEKPFNLGRHVRTVHHRVVLYQCPYCPKKCSRLDNTRQHVNRVHASVAGRQGLAASLLALRGIKVVAL